ncbi:hypothetical protein HETIRDRAFT_422383 [Heterobasidion irregulare TC 32-1]|uniref:Uncharacterized protein n=1 Tax=Heterobasidion irregulare (strain TC 32-1) TaxID=747525 RepID=W4JQA0_HETIT|nr:uncharacterized protein HETIRDRAFT_422383 [Heterobasidion irregulare TC 32-1]ETW75713.1 hypothetical protein HETIRDRAFT_422383 [Heterobasidion irregulare TC 32-1]
MRYRHACYNSAMRQINKDHALRDFADVWDGTDFIDAVKNGLIKEYDPVVMFSIDGAQLYCNKGSDCWIYIWVILDRSPDLWYKKKYVLPGGFIPGPSKPKNLDSFIFPGMYHLSALQREGIPAMASIFGGVGHHGAYGCRLYCPQKGRHKPGGAQYYPACLKPVDSDIASSNHPNYDLRTMIVPTAEETEKRYLSNLTHVSEARSAAEYRARRLQTGLCKPTLLSGIDPRHRLRIPALFPTDLMHLCALNLTELIVGLLLGLLHGTLDCSVSDNRDSWTFSVLRDLQIWQAHGKAVAAATPYLPGIFDQPPRNPAEKINSGYKAVEYMTWIYGLAPTLLYRTLPSIFWRHFCKLVAGIRLVHQRRISQKELRRAHRLLIEYAEDFEVLYYQRRTSRLHFCRQSIHALSHLARQVTRCGPPGYTTQYTMERMIGDLGSELKQHSNPYANLSQRGVRRAQVNALKTMLPDLERNVKEFPRGAHPVGDNFVLLRAKDSCARPVLPCEALVIKGYFREAGGIYHTEGEGAEAAWIPMVQQWARLCLPNGQAIRSLWKESLKALNEVQIARNVKITFGGVTRFAEVRFFFTMRIRGVEHALALVSLYTHPDPTLLHESSGTVASCIHQGDAALAVIHVKCIIAGIAMERFFVVEKLGLDVACMNGIVEETVEE